MTRDTRDDTRIQGLDGLLAAAAGTRMPPVELWSPPYCGDIGMAIAADVGIDPRAVAVIVAIAASASFATPIGYQTNLMVMGPGGYRFTDYIRVGLPLNLIVMLLALAIVPRLWM